jgi:hypothetical protein
MPVEPANRVYEVPVVKREEGVGTPPRRKPKPNKKEEKKESGRKIDIKV